MIHVVTEKTVQVLRALKAEGHGILSACDYLDWSYDNFRLCAQRDGHWNEISAMFPPGGSKPGRDQGGMRKSNIVNIEKPAGSRWLTQPWRKSA